jgi:hypothetical protein
MVGIFMLIEFKSDDPESVVCWVVAGLEVEVPVVEVGNPLPDPKIDSRLPDDWLEAAVDGLGVGDAPPPVAPFDGIPSGGAPFCGGEPPDGPPLCGGMPPGPLPPLGGCMDPSAEGNAVGVITNVLLLPVCTGTSDEPFSGDMTVSRLTFGLAFCGWTIASEWVAWLRYTTTSIAIKAKKITNIANTLRFIGFHKRLFIYHIFI